MHTIYMIQVHILIKQYGDALSMLSSSSAALQFKSYNTHCSYAHPLKKCKFRIIGYQQNLAKTWYHIIGADLICLEHFML